MFKGQAVRLRFKPIDGTAVVVTAKASLYDRDGKFQLYVSAMAADGLGDLYLAYEQMKKRLDAEGLFDPAHKKPIPRLPGASVRHFPSGAVIRDIIRCWAAFSFFPNFRLSRSCPCPGEGCCHQHSAAFDRFNDIQPVDA
jgi:exodeoxyribonuclease VII large subunit